MNLHRVRCWAILLSFLLAACSSSSNSNNVSPATGGAHAIPPGGSACSDWSSSDAGTYLTECPTCEKYCACVFAVLTGNADLSAISQECDRDAQTAEQYCQQQLQTVAQAAQQTSSVLPSECQ